MYRGKNKILCVIICGKGDGKRVGICKYLESVLTVPSVVKAAYVVALLGYYVFEGFLYGFAPSAVNIPANGVQGCAGLVLGLILIKMLEKTKIISNSNIRSKLS